MVRAFFYYVPVNISISHVGTAFLGCTNILFCPMTQRRALCEARNCNPSILNQAFNHYATALFRGIWMGLYSKFYWPLFCFPSERYGDVSTICVSVLLLCIEWVINHSFDIHSEEPLKCRQLVLDSSTGKFKCQTKQYDVLPSKINSQEST